MSDAIKRIIKAAEALKRLGPLRRHDKLADQVERAVAAERKRKKKPRKVKTATCPECNRTVKLRLSGELYYHGGVGCYYDGRPDKGHQEWRDYRRQQAALRREASLNHLGRRIQRLEVSVKLSTSPEARAKYEKMLAEAYEGREELT